MSDMTSISEQLRKLDIFEEAVENQWSYRVIGVGDLQPRFEAIRASVNEGLSPSEFGLELQKIIALGIDGHASVSGYRRPSDKHRTPFLIEPNGDRFVAFNPERTQFLADGHPYLVSIDGIEIGEWCNALRPIIAKGSEPYVRFECCRKLRRIDFCRGLMGEQPRDSITVTVTDPSRTSSRTIELDAVRRTPFYGSYPRTESRLLDNNIGYLRLTDMDRKAEDEIRRWMPQFADSSSLIVDVRDNRGGRRKPLRLLYSYLAANDAPPYVFNAAVYRKHPDHAADHLGRRYLHPINSKRWSPIAREAVETFANTFKPQVDFPTDQFSEWHYMVADPLREPNRYHYQKPVVILQNHKCFSATDIFLSALKQLESVTLIGEASRGGSARVIDIPLMHSGMELTIGTMLSFQSDGRLFDGEGVQPDIEVMPQPEYYIGGHDTVLQKAVDMLSG